MNEQQRLIRETLDRLLADQCDANVVSAAEAGEFPARLWQTLSDAGLTLAGIGESAGGSGGEPEDSLLVIRTAAGAGAPVPLAEHFIVASILEELGEREMPAIATIATGGDFKLGKGGNLSGACDDVAFARWCSHALVTVGDQLALLDLEQAQVSPNSNLAGEPRDRIEVNSAACKVLDAPAGMAERITLMGAATRALMMTGALESVLEMSVQYALERSQFGRAIAGFQAIQQQLAILAGEVAASVTAAHAVSRAFVERDELDVGIGKARIGEAVQLAADIAHQVHGAMGYTREHGLNHLTRRLWCWRDEYGAEAHWNRLVGVAMMQQGADGLWSAITSRG